MRIYDYSDGQVKYLRLGARARERLDDFFADVEDRKNRIEVKLWLR